MAETLHTGPLEAVPLVHRHREPARGWTAALLPTSYVGFEVGVWVDQPRLRRGDVSVALLCSRALGEVSHPFVMRELPFQRVDQPRCGHSFSIVPFECWLLTQH